MGSSQTALVGTIGVALLNPDGTVHTARATAGIYEIGGGCYGKNISFPDNWAGSLKWDTGGGSPVYACEEYVVDGLVDRVLEGTEIKRAKISDPAATSTKFITDLTESTNGFWGRGSLLFVDGQDAGQIRAIKSYAGATKEIQIQTPLSFAPADQDNFIIIPARKFLTPDVLELADAVWDELLTGATHNIPTSAGRRLRQSADVLIIREETCQAGGANNEVILDAGASAVDNFYLNDIVVLISGTGINQSRHIDSYIGSTKTAIINRDWDVNPDATTGYVIRVDSTKHVHGLEPEARQQVSDAVWDEATADHAAAGSFGYTNQHQVPSEDVEDYKVSFPAIEAAIQASEDNIRGSDGDTLETLSDQIDAVKTGTDQIITDVQFIKDIEGGRWYIDTGQKQMVFLKADNITEIARFHLRDADGLPAIEDIFERIRA
jgi:hypothetical protein